MRFSPLVCILFITLVAMASSSTLQAQTKVGDATMLGLEGTCDKLTIGKLTLGDQCSSKLLNMSYPDGRVGFYFVLDSGRIITFTGMDAKNPTPDTDVVKLDKVILSNKHAPDKPDVFKARGTCKYGNPYQGVATVSCSGKLADGRSFSASFKTNGKPPS